MGKQQYLTRLALGRSAFEPIEENQEPTPPESTETDNGHYIQQYDSKGRPINPHTEAFNAEMRKAQNDVLALVGVVERKDLSDRRELHRDRFARQTREKLLKDEQEKGELLDYALLPVGYLAHLWTEAFIQRVQVGVYAPGRSIADILTSEWRRLFSDGLQTALARIFPGFGDIIMHTLVRMPLILLVEQFTGRIQNFVQKRRFKRKTTKKLYTTISILFELALLGIDMALLPMEFHARAQKLGLAPPLPLFPSWKTFLPWHPFSFHQFGWKPLFGVVFIRSLTTPGVLLLLHKIIHWDADESEIPICGLFSNFHYPAIDANSAQIPATKEDPIGWLMFKAYFLRARFMNWCGWDIIQLAPGAGGPEEGVLESDQRRRDGGRHRSTALAHLPAQRLASSVDGFLARCMTLPFESLMLRSVANAFLTHTSSSTPPRSHIYAPFGGGPISRLLRSPTDRIAWTSAGSYTSRLGLALALDASVDMALFFGVWGATRYVGRRWFEWRPRREEREDRSARLSERRRRIGD